MDTYKKKYKEALERARVWKEKSGMPADKQGILDDIFPELAESEDEKVRKELLEHCINRKDGKQVCVDASDYRRWAAWLEKQGEQKPNPYSGTSFEYNGHTWGMCARDNGVDILCDKHIIGHLEEQGEAYTKRDVDDAWLEGMCDAKRELEKQSEQNSSWSKEDDVRLQACIDTLQAESIYGKVDTIMTKWLKSVKDRVQPKQEWSEVDEERLSDAIFFVREYQIPTRDKRLLNAAKETEDWLKSLKQRIGGKL